MGMLIIYETHIPSQIKVISEIQQTNAQCIMFSFKVSNALKLPPRLPRWLYPNTIHVL